MSGLAFDPQVVLTGGTVRLRPIHEGDLDAAWEMLCDDEGRRLTGTHTEFTREAADRWYRSRGQDRDRLDLAIATLDADRFVGEAVLNDLDPDNRSCSFRISLLGPSVFGRGYGTEATRLILDHAFATVGVHRVGLEVYDFNVRARHVYEKVGFRHEGTLREALSWEGRFHDVLVMGLLASEWRGTGPGDPAGRPARAATAGPGDRPAGSRPVR
ncbi:GNAT family N-acetyltransferase [Egicoccus sp. AB-alg2]|uniref:GNAT family N-acetyltransferase n=1 Tax=Egicoccus sp. AB-alg2 TaxID=3242693 RepID=UPI00359DBC43